MIRGVAVMVCGSVGIYHKSVEKFNTLEMLFHGPLF